MQTIKGKAYYQQPKFDTLRDLLQYSVNRFGPTPAYCYHEKPGDPDTIRTYHDLDRDIRQMGTGLMLLGLHGQHIAIIGDNSYNWVVAHNGVVNGTGVSVPLDRQLPEQEVISLTSRGQATAFIYGARHHAIAQAVAAINPTVRYFICMKPDTIEPELRARDSRFMAMQEVLQSGAKALTTGDRQFLDAKIDPDAMCSLLFTSGTTAMSKGVMLSHRNITSNVHAVMSTIHLEPGQRALSVLPLHHTFENTVGLYMMLSFGICICFLDNLRYMAQNLKEWRINILLAVPLLFENIYHQIQKNLIKTNKLQLVNTMRKISNVLRKVGLDLRKKLFHQIIDGVGGGLNLCVCGAAAIDSEIVSFFNDIGIKFWCGYGLTETSPVIAATNDFVNIYGSVGNPLAGIEAAIDTDEKDPGAIGEILTRSSCVMLGYYENAEATAEAIRPDGWLKTGDIGYLDKKGCIHITGRLKSMIVLTNGKKAFPEEIEFLISHIEGVKESMTWGDTSSHETVDICARIIIDPERLPNGSGQDTDQISRYLSEQLKLINQQMPTYKSIKYYIWGEQDLIKTTTLKVKRPIELEHIHALLAAENVNMKQANGRKLDSGSVT